MGEHLELDDNTKTALESSVAYSENKKQSGENQVQQQLWQFAKSGEIAILLKPKMLKLIEKEGLDPKFLLETALGVALKRIEEYTPITYFIPDNLRLTEKQIEQLEDYGVDNKLIVQARKYQIATSVTEAGAEQVNPRKRGK